MTAPLALRDYFASVGSGFTKQDAEVIGPQIEAMAEEGDVTERLVVDTARSSNSPLHRFFEWDEAAAADKYRLHQAGTMMRSIRVKVVEDDRPKVRPVYKLPTPAKSAFSRGHNVLHGDSAFAVQKAAAAMEDLIAWRARYSPYIVVWKDFAQVFCGVANQIGEAEDMVASQGLADKTDAALTDMLAIIGSCREWESKHGSAAAAWPAISEQVGFIVDAIQAAEIAFRRDKPMERVCMRCGRAFQSGGVGNRLCERCLS